LVEKVEIIGIVIPREMLWLLRACITKNCSLQKQKFKFSRLFLETSLEEIILVSSKQN
jgi:hypothetical protein